MPSHHMLQYTPYVSQRKGDFYDNPMLAPLIIIVGGMALVLLLWTKSRNKTTENA